MASSSRPRLVLYAASTLTLALLGYYGVQETIRSRVLRKRKRRYARALLDVEASGGEGKELSLRAAHDLFASLTILGRYQNPFSEWREEGAWEWLAWHTVKLFRGRLGWDGGISDANERARILPSERPSFKLLFGVEPALMEKGRIEDLTMLDSLLPTDNIEQVADLPPTLDRTTTPDDWERLSRSSDPGTAITVTPDLTCSWFGQSSCFITFEGACILTDPVWGDRLVDYLGPKRLRPPPAPLADLLQIDAVLVSHDHFDHLDAAVIDYLANSTLWVIPLGLGQLFRSRGVTRFIELDWWQSEKLPIPSQPTVTFCPTMHWSGRNPRTTFQSLWGSYALRGEKDSLFHCGDTGYVPALFETIGRHYGPFSLALLPIGAYQPRWHLAPQHIDPDSAVLIHKALRSKRSIGYHWGTWSLSDDRYDDPPKDLAIARKLHDVADDAFTTVSLGSTLTIST